MIQQNTVFVPLSATHSAVCKWCYVFIFLNEIYQLRLKKLLDYRSLSFLIHCS